MPSLLDLAESPWKLAGRGLGQGVGNSGRGGGAGQLIRVWALSQG